LTLFYFPFDPSADQSTGGWFGASGICMRPSDVRNPLDTDEDRTTG